MSTEIVCRDLIELITAYLDGALDPETTAAMDAHLSLCDGCSRVLEQFRATIRMAGMLRDDDIASGQRELLRETFRDWVAD
jgi:anti-sigma factor RsiW